MLFGPSKAELADRIEVLNAEINELSDEVSDLNADVSIAQRKARDAEARANRAENKATQEAEKAASIAHALNELHTDTITTLENKKGEVETLDNPRIAWKATNNQIAKLLIPEGATVVHPEGSGEKKRGSEAIVLAFYDYQEQTTYNGLGGSKMWEKSAEGPVLETEDRSKYSRKFTYEIGEKVTPDNGPLNLDVSVECESGIHFFPSKDAALDWY